jgi:phage baseplate assembly protein V
VQVHLPEMDPWARVAVLMGGMNSGTYFIPQVGDEVLVAFNHGDLRDAYVIGSVWNKVDRPPTSLPSDAVNRRVIRTPGGHELVFDDLGRSITITSITKQKITIDPTKIEITTTENKVSLKLDKAGNLSVESARSIALKAPRISIEGDSVEIKSSTRTDIDGGQACDIQAGLVKIN